MDASEAGPPTEAGPPEGTEAAPDDGNPPAADNADGSVRPPDPNFDFTAPLPEVIHIERVGRISDIKSIWRSGIKQIEEIFADHVARINDLFDERALEFDRLRDQLLTNHEFLKRFQ